MVYHVLQRKMSLSFSEVRQIETASLLVLENTKHDLTLLLPLYLLVLVLPLETAFSRYLLCIACSNVISP